MAVTAKMFASLPHWALQAKISDLNQAGYVKCALFTSAAAPNQETMESLADAVATMTQVANGNGYTTGGVAVTNPALAEGTLVTNFDCDNPAWSAASFTARYAIYYDSHPASDATRGLLSYIDFGADVTVTNGTLTIVVDSAGVFTLTVA